MARAKFIDSDDFVGVISRAVTDYPEIAAECLRVGADIIADEMKKQLKGVLLPESRNGELVAHFGITPVKRDREGNYNLHLGFDGYEAPGYGQFPQGVPYQLIARTFESGAVSGGRYTGEWRGKKRVRKKASEIKGKYWRQPTHFATNAVRAAKAKAINAMEDMARKKLSETK